MNAKDTVIGAAKQIVAEIVGVVGDGFIANSLAGLARDRVDGVQREPAPRRL
jgi:hypothetical protein